MTYNKSGILLADKPSGISSFGVVAIVRRRISQELGKKVKVGHTGTLDPFATGLMVLVIGDYCKRASEFSKLDKTYQATLKLGSQSSTGDPEGTITPVSTNQPSRNELLVALQRFIGDITQIPPAYSAIKVNGQRAYALARQGKPVVLQPRAVTVHSLALTDYAYPYARIEVLVSSGTYIRTLVQDIGQAVGTGAYTTELRRTTVGKWDIKDSISPDQATTQHVITI